MSNVKLDFCANVYNNVKFAINDGGLLFCLKNNIIIFIVLNKNLINLKIQVLLILYILIRPKFIKYIKKRFKNKSDFSKSQMDELEKPRTSVYQIKLSEIKPQTSFDDYKSYIDEIKVKQIKL